MASWYVAEGDTSEAAPPQADHLIFKSTQAESAFVCHARQEAIFVNFYGQGIADPTNDAWLSEISSPTSPEWRHVPLCPAGAFPLDSHDLFAAYARQVETLAAYTSVFAGAQTTHPLSTLYNFTIDAPKRRRLV
jgi:hypothetical protein